MPTEVGININLFRSNVEKLRSSLADLEIDGTKTKSFHHTNINPFKGDLQSLIKTIELLQRYKTILNGDIHTLKQTGEAIRENDERIAKSLHMNPPTIN